MASFLKLLALGSFVTSGFSIEATAAAVAAAADVCDMSSGNCAGAIVDESADENAMKVALLQTKKASHGDTKDSESTPNFVCAPFLGKEGTWEEKCLYGNTLLHNPYVYAFNQNPGAANATCGACPCCKAIPIKTNFPLSWQYGNSRQRCEGGNTLNDGYMYFYNSGRGTAKAVCGESARYDCCKAKLDAHVVKETFECAPSIEIAVYGKYGTEKDKCEEANNMEFNPYYYHYNFGRGTNKAFCGDCLCCKAYPAFSEYSQGWTYGSSKDRCLAGNEKQDGYLYIYNKGRQTPLAACSEGANWECCKAKLSPPSIDDADFWR